MIPPRLIDKDLILVLSTDQQFFILMIIKKKIATESKINFAKENNLIIVTEISQLSDYYKAEEYHQKYIQKTGLHCAV